MSLRCECGYEGPSLESHYFHSPHCRPPPPSPLPPKKRAGYGAYTALFKQRVLVLFTKEMLKAHFDMCIGVHDLEHARSMMIAMVRLVVQFVAVSDERCAAVVSEITKVFEELPSVNEAIAQGRKKYLRVEPLAFKNMSKDDKSGAIFFSIYQLVTVILQESATVRSHSIESSEEWKTGELYNKQPQVLSSVIHGRRFWSNHQICGKASEDEKKDLRIVMKGWTDEFTTVDGLGVAAKDRKYGVVLGGIVNLPIVMQHFFDYILVLCIYNSKYAKEHGGLVRMLTGVDAKGKRHPDGLTLASEIELGRTSGVWIELPNHKDETDTQPVHWRLRIFFLLISLDWLAAGDFGPFAASVSARYPCGRCMWTSKCPCGYKPAGVLVTHTAHCRGSAERTHVNTMEVVHELRLWQGTQAALKARSPSLSLSHPLPHSLPLPPLPSLSS
jgi:hypothetical protein